MKPLKGMNLDVSPNNQPDGTYRKATNWVYGRELDALMQEPGTEQLVVMDKHVIGGYAIDDATFVMFALDVGVEAITGSAILLYNVGDSSVSTLVENDELGFRVDTVFDIVTFRNFKSERIVVFTDNLNPPRIINVDDPDINLDRNKLFPNFITPQLTDVTVIAGSLPAGSFFWSFAYETKDGVRTPFSDVVGPYQTAEDGVGYILDFGYVDTNYDYLLIAVIAASNGGNFANVVNKVRIGSSSIQATVTGAKIMEELVFEDIVVTPTTYTKAKTLAIQNNRLYMGNVAQHTESGLQEIANRIEPQWEVVADSDNNATVSDQGYTTDISLAFGEVYAFYVAFVRPDGTLTRAYHIPGRDHTVYGQTFEVDGIDYDIDETLDTLSSSLSYLTHDLTATNEAGIEGRYWHTRDTVTNVFAGVTSLYGRCGIWKNASEVYPSDFPVKREYESAASTSAYTETLIAGENVLHHRMPTLRYLQDVAPNFSPLHLMSKSPVLKAKFVHVEIPEGYVGVKFYHAKRNYSNCTVLGQDSAVHGTPNFYAEYGNGGTAFRTYYSRTGMNLPLRNAVVTENTNYIFTTSEFKDAWGLETNGGTASTDTYYDRYVRPEFVTLRPMEMLEERPFLPKGIYLRYETADFFIEQDGPSTPGYYPASQSSAYEEAHRIMQIDATSEIDYYITSTHEVFFKNRFLELRHAGMIKVPEELAISAAYEAQYCAAATVNEDLLFDNRFGEECIGLKVTAGAVNIVSSVYKTTVYQGTNNSTGFMVDAMTLGYDENDPGPVSYVDVFDVAARATVMVARSDCYEGYYLQDLVAITPVLGSQQIAQTTTPTELCIGDAYTITTRLRVTAPVGFNAIGNGSGSAPFIGSVPGHLDLSNGTASSTRGVIRTVRAARRQSRYNYRMQDHVQSKLTYWNFVNRPADGSETNLIELLWDYKWNNEFQQPLIDEWGIPYLYQFPYRIVRSEASQPDDRGRNMQTFPPLNYFEQTKSRGQIINLADFQDKMLIHHEDGLFITVGQEALASTAGEIVLGSGDIFRTVPQEVMPSEYGIAGCQHLLGCTMTPQGYFFVDVKRREVYLYNGQLVNLSDKGLRDYFSMYLELLYQDYTGELNIQSGAVHTFMPGVLVEYDPMFNRVVLMVRRHRIKRKPDGTPIELTDWPLTLSEYDVSLLKADYTVSFSMDSQSWTSFHSYQADFMFATNNDLYSIVNSNFTSLHKHAAYDVLPNSYLSKTRGKSSIDVAVPVGATGVFSNFTWHTSAKDKLNEQGIQGVEDSYGYDSYTNTFVRAMVYNDYQCSGYVDLLTVTPSSLEYNLRRVEDDWVFNGFRDIVIDRTQRFLDEELEPILSNLDSGLSWYDKRRIISKYAIVRLQTSSSTTERNLLHLYEVNSKVRKSYR